ncbi:MAG: CRISPR-associated helicase Cas3' [Acidaminobacteraceae bacterium]
MELSNYFAKPNVTVKEHNNNLIERADTLRKLNYITDESYNLLKLSCEIHDLGKVNPYFQKRIEYGGKFDKKNEFAHNLLSLFYVDIENYELDDYYIIANAVLNHHHYVKNFEAIQDKHESESMYNQLKDFGAGEVYKIKRITSKNIKKIYITDLAILIKGLLHKCDYSASAGIEIEYENDFLKNGLDSLLAKWKSKNVDSNWNELQQFCIENENENLMVVAQTGMGKTEAGLHWIGDTKGFFILPIKAAINSIFKRIYKDILDDDKILISKRLSILHSESLNIQRTVILEVGEQEEALKDYYNQSKQLSLPLNISTLDQLFNFVFKYPGYELKLSTLSYSKIVIDEIQMYSPDLLAYLIYGMQRVSSLGGKFAILTATLSPFVKELMKEKTKIQFKETSFVNDIKRHNIRVINEKITGESINEIFNVVQESSKSFKVLIVCNTIRKSQEIYDYLAINSNADNINLLHSKFIRKDRSEKESKIIKFGETYNENGSIDVDNGIWISTQIVEASLDIDFDFLITELSELNSLFQRLGRCNRKGVKNVDKENCFVFTKIDNSIIRKDNSSKGFIYKDIYDLSKEALENISGVITENEKIALIDKTFSKDNLCGSQYHKDFKYYYDMIEDLYPGSKTMADTVKEFRNISSCDMIPTSVYNENREVIDGYLELTRDSQLSWIEKENYISKIKDYTLPIEYSRILSKKAFASKVVEKTIKLNTYIEIYIVNCYYDYKKGFTNIIYEDKEEESNFI